MSADSSPIRRLLERRQHQQLTPLDLARVRASYETDAQAVRRVVASIADVLHRETDLRLDEEEMRAHNTLATRDYLRSLPAVNLSELEPHSLDCPICHEPFASSAEGKGPVRMTCCRKAFDTECITTWLSSEISQGRCPNCRKILFAPHRNLSMTVQQQEFHEHIATLLRDGVPQYRAGQGNATGSPQQTTLWQLGEQRLQSLLDMPSASMKAWQLLVAFRLLLQSDPLLSQPDRVQRWEVLAGHIEHVRARLVALPGELELGFGDLWNQRGPSIPILRIARLRPLVDEYLEQLVRAESAVRTG